MKIKFSKKVPKEEGLYFYNSSGTVEKAIELVYIDEALWVHDYPYMKGRVSLASCYGLWSEKLEFFK